ncbi:MAG: hypothetical protein KAJ10_05275 [Thermodesulfovibrionia bacterium]|nr:hypothetical protein [Thermodesulfovibrionia bacterium]
MQKPMGRIETIAASGRNQIPGNIPLVRARTLSVTVQMTFGGSIDADATAELYYAPDEDNWDTLTYCTQTITFTAGAFVQKTFIVDPPEHGQMIIKVLNGSQSDTITDIRAWYSIQSWPHFGGDSRGLIETIEVYD